MRTVRLLAIVVLLGAAACSAPLAPADTSNGVSAQPAGSGQPANDEGQGSDG